MTQNRDTNPARLCTGLLGILVAMAGLGLGGANMALADTPLPVRLGSQNGASRLVFDWPKMTGYKIEQSGATVKIIFESAAIPSLPAVDHTLNPQIKSIRASGPSEISIDLAEGATLTKDFRVVRKVILDISGGPAPAKPGPMTMAATAPAMTKPPPPDTAPQKPLPVVEAKPPVAPAPAPAAASAPAPLPKQETPVAAAIEKPAKPLALAEPPAENGDETEIAAEPSRTAAEIQPDLPPTVISFSTLDPANIAVFRRDDFLWIVLDTATGGIAPQIFGPLSGALGSPRNVPIKDGAAFRFLFPEDASVLISRENLSWQVIFKKVEQKTFGAAQIRPAFDPPGNKNARLIVDVKGNSRVLELEDPASGDRLIVVPAQDAAQKMDQGVRLTDLEILPSEIGLVLRPLRDKLKVERKGEIVVLSAPGGLALTPGASAIPVAMSASGAEDHPRLFDFPGWRQGGLSRLNQNKRVIEQEIFAAGSPEKRSEGMLKLALLFFANNFGQETLGILRQALAENPKLAENPGFVALRGAAQALSGHYQDAIADLSIPALAGQAEADLWKAYAAANTEQWTLAARLFPKNNRLLAEYPANIALPFTLFMAESALRLGEKERAKELLGTLNALGGEMPERYLAAVMYLKGEAARQDGDADGALKSWAGILSGRDRLYRAKANLATVNLLLEEKRIPVKEAVERIDNLRFAWRDNGLETAILHRLGSLKIQNGQYLEGLKDLRAAVTIAEGNLEDSEPIAADMEAAFEDLFINGKAAGIPPLEAIAVFGDFGELLPPGARGNQATRNFAEYLIGMDLLDRAAELLEDQIAHHAEDGSAPQLGVKLAAIYLLNSLPSKAIDVINRTDDPMLSESARAERRLLTARAWFQQERMDMAMAALDGLQTPDALKLMADIFWRTQKWADAATTIEQLLPPPGSDLTDADAELVVNAAVATKLGNDRDRLQALKDRYGPAIEKTKMAQTFQVITRKPGVSTLSDRETMMKIAGEVDMFKGFLNDYKASSTRKGS